MSTVDIVKYYFHKDHVPKTAERIQQLVALAYQTARDKQLYPRAVFIRSELHDTTSINSIRERDPKGLHCTPVWPSAGELYTAPEIGYGHWD
ncbi:hypothetical protein LY76DRAFT_629074 [Colletotrichum caudatum]|nr:hypothetical protein LY76DRAFT_629074 [Colletotrichum caudatum]